jgi:hypothetical protein
MRKSLIVAEPDAARTTAQGGWLNLDQLATVEITSEDSLFPIEHALGAAPTTGWRASAKGPQVIRLNFDQPVAISRLQLHFIDRAAERSQEFAICATNDGGELREVVRQQFTFSPGGSTEEIEDYAVALDAVTQLEIRIDPDRAHDPAHSQNYASLQSLHIS